MRESLTWKDRYKQIIKRHKKHRNAHTIMGTVMVLLLIFLFVLLEDEMPLEAHPNSDAFFTATMVGDIMTGRHVQEVTDRYGYDYLFRYVQPYLLDSDYVTGNFEHPVILDEGYPQELEEHVTTFPNHPLALGEEYPEADKYIHLKGSVESVEALQRMNFSNLNLANNHTMDFGQPGLADTLETFRHVGMDYVGAGENYADRDILYQEINGITIATLGFADAYASGFSAQNFRGGIFIVETGLDPDQVPYYVSDIVEARANADLVIVHMHWGREYDNSADPYIVELAHLIADAGADIIIGHHPHVLMSTEIYSSEFRETDTAIFYSLGNFIFDQGWTRTRETALAQYQLLEEGQAQIELTPLWVQEAHPRPLSGPLKSYRQSRIFRALTKETEADFYHTQEGTLRFELDHSHVLEGMSQDGE